MALNIEPPIVMSTGVLHRVVRIPNANLDTLFGNILKKHNVTLTCLLASFIDVSFAFLQSFQFIFFTLFVFPL